MTTPVQPQRVEFVRAISRLDATALVVGSMIGSGIFIVSAEILRQVHTPGLLLLVWLISGAVTLLGALTYGELAAMYPKAGGNYVYLREGISPLLGYLYGWTLFVVIQTGTIAAVAVAFARFTAVLVPGISADVFAGTTLHFPKPIGDIAVGLSWQRLLAIASVAVLTWINVRGVRTAAVIQTSLTIIKTAALAALIVLGLTIGRNAEAIVATSSEGRPPVGTTAMQAMLGTPGLYVMAVAIMISTFGCNNGLILSGARVFYAVTAVGLFRLRQRRPDIPRPVKAPGYPILPALYVALTGLIAIDLLVQPVTRTYAMLGLALVLLGVPVYFAWRRFATPV